MAWNWKSSNDKESGSLKEFRETLKDVLEEITTLEINTMIVDEISTEKFDVEDFLNEVKGNIDIESVEQPIYVENGSDPKEIQEKLKLKKKRYKELDTKISKFQIGFETKNGQERLSNKDAQMIRYFRKLWEVEQSFINGDRIYAQTKLTLDGDLTNRYIKDLFKPTQSDVEPELDPKMAGLILSLHRQGVVNAQNQWSSLINTCVDLVKSLIPFRKQP